MIFAYGKRYRKIRREQMKKFLSLVIAVTMMLTLTSLSMISEAGTAGEYAAAVTTSSAVAPGQTITVTVTVGNIAKATGGLSAVGITLKYDANAFGYVSGSATATKMPDKWTSSVSTEDLMFGEISLFAETGLGADTYVQNNGDLVFTLRLTARPVKYTSPQLTTITCSALGGAPANQSYVNIISGDSINAQLYLTQSMGERPAAPKLMTTLDNTVYLIIGSQNLEYSYDLVNWQKSGTFENLAAGTYSFYARTAAVGSNAAGEPSAPLVVNVGGEPGHQTESSSQTTYIPPMQTTVDDPIVGDVIKVESVTDTTITLTRNANCEFSIDGRTWQDSNVITGLTPKTSYHIFIRNKVTNEFDSISASTGRKQQSAPGEPEVETKSATSVTLKAVDGCEYSLDGKTWQKSNVFEGLGPRKIYTFSMRYAETDEYDASPASPKIYVLTEVLCDHESTTTDGKPSTCTEHGYERVTCNSCGKELSYKELPLADHQGEWIGLEKPTCTKSGSEICICQVCSQQIGERTVPATGHVVTEWKTTKEATTTEEGEEVRYCVECNEVLETRSIPMLEPETTTTETTVTTETTTTVTTETTTTEETTTVETTTETETTSTTETTSLETTTLETTSSEETTTVETTTEVTTPEDTTTIETTSSTALLPITPDDDDGISPGSVVLIVALVVIASVASVVAVLWVLSANMPRKKRTKIKSRGDEE